jgi:threonine synthase
MSGRIRPQAGVGLEALKAAAFDFSPDPAMVVDGDGSLVAVNEAAEALFGQGLSLLARGRFGAALPPGSALVSLLDRALEEGVRVRERGVQISLFGLPSFEICDDLGRAPDILAIPVGNAGNISAYWAGFEEYAAAGHVAATPRMFGFQAAGAAPLVTGTPVDEPDTIATAIRIGNPASWDKAIAARDDSGGRIEAVTDDEILAAYRALAAEEGLFCEPSSAASVAGVTRLAPAGSGVIARDELVVCVLTGTGLKDPATAESQIGAGRVIEAEPTVGAVAVALGW